MPRHSRNSAFLALALAIAGSHVSVAQAEDAPLTGKALTLADSPVATKRHSTVVLTGAAIDLTGVDPTATGATLTLGGTVTSYLSTIVLAPPHWTRSKGKKLVYSYRERSPGTQTVVAKLVAGKLLKVRVVGSVLSALGMKQTGIGVTFDLNTLRLCGAFGGKVRRDTGKVFAAGKAAPPVSCPATGSTTTTTVSVTTSTTNDGTPSPPVLGTQVDRDGRPGVSPLLLGLPADTNTFGQRRDQYNAASTPSGWAVAFEADIRTALGVWDALDLSCGNQIGAAVTLDANRYAALSGILVDDQLFVDTRVGTCGTYLFLEKATLSNTALGADCGGRVPGIDVVDPTYSLLVHGTPAGVTDGVANDNSAISTTFPFLGAPN